MLRGVQERGEERSEHLDNHLKKSDEIKIRVLGQGHLQVSISYTNIGSMCGDQGDLENALLHSQKAHEVFSAVKAYENTMVEYNELLRHCGQINPLVRRMLMQRAVKTRRSKLARIFLNKNG